jgi:D-alanyl-D-alanine carboxypeptidase/D-alanyl-D-alanine-endopeptidase (penicillin-binding protein 4)
MAYSRAQRLVRRVVLPLFALSVLVFGAWLGGTVFLHATGLAVGGGESTIDPLRYATPEPSRVPIAPSLPLPESTLGALPDAAAVLASIQAMPPTGLGNVGWSVVDPTTGDEVTGEAATALMTPASTWKLLTAAAVLAVLGEGHRFPTTVVQSGSGIVLVGGGDPYLLADPAPGYPAWASLTELADATVAALAASGTTTTRLSWDESWFAGPGWNPNWEEEDAWFVTGTSALWADHGVTNGARSATPAADAAYRFADLLRERGIDAGLGGAEAAPATATEVARVNSPPLGVIVQEYLLSSDNDVAEVLLRQVARARGTDGSLAAAHATVPVVLAELGLWSDGMVADDGSGLSRANQVSPVTIARAVALGLRDPAYRAILAGLPTAGGDGTLVRRFNDPEEIPGRGLVRAKTGSLTGVDTLAGTVRTRSGAIVAFAFMVNQSPDDWGANDWIDRASALIAMS